MMYRLVLIITLLFALSGCKTRVVPVDVHHYHQDSLVTIQRDTILQVDSIIIQQRGDTIYIRETSDRVRISNEQKSQHRVDSVPIPPQLIPPTPPPEGGIKDNTLIVVLVITLFIALYLSYRAGKKK